MAIVSLPLPIQLVNGIVADGGQVMTDLNAIASNVNANAAKNGVNNDITSLTALISIAPGLTITNATITNSAINGGTITGATIVNTGGTFTNPTIIGGTATGLALDATSTVPTAPPGTNTTEIASTAFVINQAFSTVLPSQAGNAGKFLSTDGTTASWKFPGITSFTPVSSATTITLTSASAKGQVVTMTALGQSVVLPDATTLTATGPIFIIRNAGGYPFGIRANGGGLITGVAAGGEVYVTLENASTAAGVWSFQGSGLEPGLITIDNTFGSTFTNVPLFPFVALDANTSIHFLSLASGFAAFICDNTGKVISTPVTVDATASSRPVQIFKVTATTALLFYGTSATSNSAVVLSVSGSSPTLTLAVGTPQTFATSMTSIWAGEDFNTVPKIVQLTATLYLTAYVNTTTAFALAISVSGVTVTIGTAASIGTAGSGTTNNGVYALTATTGIVFYSSTSVVPITVAASVITVAGTTCTPGTVATGGGNSVPGPISTCLLSPTKLLYYVDNNTSTTLQAGAVTVAGTTITFGTLLTIETGATGIGGSNILYSANNASRYNPHISALGSNSGLIWYVDTNNFSRAVVVTEATGVLTAGQIFYRNISSGALSSDQAGAIFPQGTSEYLVVKAENVSSFSTRFRLVPNKITGTSSTVGTACYVEGVSPSNAPLPSSIGAIRLSSGDYVMVPSANGGMDSIPVLRSNGDYINYRGNIRCPALIGGATTMAAQPAVGSNRIVLILGTLLVGTSVAPTTFQNRMINLEIAQ